MPVLAMAFAYGSSVRSDNRNRWADRGNRPADLLPPDVNGTVDFHAMRADDDGRRWRGNMDHMNLARWRRRTIDMFRRRSMACMDAGRCLANGLFFITTAVMSDCPGHFAFRVLLMMV